MSEEHLFVLFYATPFLVRKSVLIEWCWYCYQLTGLISCFFRSLVRIIRSLSYFWIFNANKKATPNFFIEYYQRKIIDQSKGEMCSYKELLCYAYTIMFFLWLLYILKMFLLFMFGKLIIVLLESSLCFETAVKQFKIHKGALKKNWRNPGDIRHCFNVIRSIYDVAWH